MATAAFQIEDIDVVGPKSGGNDGGTSPTPASIVSLASEMFSNAPGLVADPEQYVPTSMSDLFEGALCDDEIPSLLNLTPSASPDGTSSEEALQLISSDSPVATEKATTAPAEVTPPQVTPKTNFVPISPAPALPELAPAPGPAKQGGAKRGSRSLAATTLQNKKIKIIARIAPASSALYHRPTAATTTTAQAVLQTIQPLTALPPSATVNGTRPKPGGVNTSTAHVRALTGTNGAAVCLDAIEKALQESGTMIKPDCSSSGASADGKELSAEEKARQSRDRNRQHARNTRVRKKAYVEELKRTLNQLVDERDAILHQRQMEHKGLMEQRDVRFRVIEDFLHLRGRNEADPNRWGLILEEGFCLRLPRTDIPGVVCSSGGGTEGDNAPPSCHAYPLGTSKKVLTGVKPVMEDASRVSSLLQSLGASPLSVSYQCDRDSFMMDNTSAVLSWTATSSGAVTKGAAAEFTINGNLRAGFNPISNKLVSMEFSF